MQQKTRSNVLILSIFLALSIGVVFIILLQQNSLNNAPHTNRAATVYAIAPTQPRDRTIDYQIIEGDTITSVAQKFNVSEDTIRWANNIKDDNIDNLSTLSIPPGSGIIHTVTDGDSITSIALKYHTTTEKIMNFPFNTYKNYDTFELMPGQTIFVPDGTK